MVWQAGRLNTYQNNILFGQFSAIIIKIKGNSFGNRLQVSASAVYYNKSAYRTGRNQKQFFWGGRGAFETICFPTSSSMNIVNRKENRASERLPSHRHYKESFVPVCAGLCQFVPQSRFFCGPSARSPPLSAG